MDASPHAPDFYDRGGTGSGIHPRRARQSFPHFSPGRLPAGRRADRSVHAGLCRRPGPRQRPRRDRRHSADVRRRPALHAGGSALGSRHRHSRRHRPDRQRDRAGDGPCLFPGLVGRRRPRVRSGAVGRQHRRAAARHAGTAADRNRARPHRGRLAGGRGFRDDPHSRAAAEPGRHHQRNGGARASARWSCPFSSRSARLQPSSP